MYISASCRTCCRAWRRHSWTSAPPKNAVLYRGDVQYDPDELDSPRSEADRSKLRIEELLRPGQAVLCQVTKNPIGEKGARLTQEVSLAGRFVVLVPNSSGFGISKRLPEPERRRLRSILERFRPKGHGLIMRTAAENVTAEEIERDVARLVGQWSDIKKLAAASKAPAMLYREPEAPLRLIREELNTDFRGVIIDDRSLYEETSAYIKSIIGPLSDRVQFYDKSAESLPLFERYYVTEQLRKALEPKVWLPSGGSLIIEHTEALTVVDVNTGKNVGKSSLRDTVLSNNLEAAEELARQFALARHRRHHRGRFRGHGARRGPGDGLEGLPRIAGARQASHPGARHQRPGLA